MAKIYHLEIDIFLARSISLIPLGQLARARPIILRLSALKCCLLHRCSNSFLSKAFNVIIYATPNCNNCAIVSTSSKDWFSLEYSVKRNLLPLCRCFSQAHHINQDQMMFSRLFQHICNSL